MPNSVNDLNFLPLALTLKDGLSTTELPEQFQKVSIDPNTTAIREALERGEKLDFAQLGERGISIRIK